MKKTVLVYLCLIQVMLCSAQKFSQEEFFLSNGLIDIQGGWALPAGDFALSNIIQREAGYAKSGFNFKAGIQYDIAPFIGLALQYQYTQNPVDSKELMDDWHNAATTLGPTEYILNAYSSNPWRLNGVLMGIYYPFKTTKTTLDLRLLGGLFSGVLPESEENVTERSTSQTYNFKNIENKSSGLGFQAGIKIRYQLYEQLVLSSSIDYTQTTLDFEDNRAIDTYTNTSYKRLDYTQRFQVFNFSVGLGFQFN